MKKIEEDRRGGGRGGTRWGLRGVRIACESTISPHPATYSGEGGGGEGAKSWKNLRVKKFQPNIIFQLKRCFNTLLWWPEHYDDDSYRLIMISLMMTTIMKIIIMIKTVCAADC